MAVVNNIDKRIRYVEGSDKPEHPKLNGNVISIFPIKHERPWHEDKPADSNGNKRVERSTPPEPYGTETFGWDYYRDYLDKLKPGAVPLSFPQFMDQLDLSPQDFFGKAPESEEGLLSLITPTQRKEIMGMIKAFININKERA